MRNSIVLVLLFISGCTDKLYMVNKEINSYHYIPDKVNYMKTPQEFYKDGGGDCEDFANAKKAILGGELVQMPMTFPESHVMLKVNGWLLDNRNNELRPASTLKAYPYKG